METWRVCSVASWEGVEKGQGLRVQGIGFSDEGLGHRVQGFRLKV